MQYDLDGAVESDPHILEVLDAPEEASFDKMIQILLRDVESGALPTGTEPNFSELWKNYMKALGTELNLKGKESTKSSNIASLNTTLLHPSYTFS